METNLSQTTIPCACKGVRSCYLCEPEKESNPVDDSTPGPIFIYCDGCRQAIRMDIYEIHSECPHKKENDNQDVAIPIDGVCLVSDFINEDEERQLMSRIDNDVWIPSQSGRLKQDFGIKINFKKQTIKTKYFTGMPWYSNELIERFRKQRLLKDFESVELCNLDYRSERGSHIDSHIDDIWIWGERLITINLLSNTILTLTSNNKENPKTIYVPLPRRWLIVLYGDARYEYKHAVQRQHIQDRRVAMTFRELTSKNEKFYEENKELYDKILRIGQRFTGISVGRFEHLANLYQQREKTEENCSMSQEEIDKFLDKNLEFPSNGSLVDQAQFVARWRLATRDQTKTYPINYLDERWWTENYCKVLEEKKTNYPFLLSNLFTCEDQIESQEKNQLETGFLWSKKRFSYYLIDLASILVEDLSSAKEILASYEQICPLNSNEINFIDCFVRLEIVSSIVDERRTAEIEHLSTNLFSIRSKIR